MITLLFHSQLTPQEPLLFRLFLGPKVSFLTFWFLHLPLFYKRHAQQTDALISENISFIVSYTWAITEV